MKMIHINSYVLQVLAVLGLVLLIMPCYAQALTPNLWKPYLSDVVRKQQWQYYSRHVDRLEVWGTGPLWQKMTGLQGTQGIRVHDRRLALALLKRLRFTNETIDDDTPDYADSANDTHYPQGQVTVYFLVPPSLSQTAKWPFPALEYDPRRGGPSRALGEISQDELIVMRHRQQFQHWFPGFINGIARRVRLNDRRMSYFLVQGD